MYEDDDEANTLSLHQATESQENSDIVKNQSSDDKKKSSLFKSELKSKSMKNL